MGVVFTQESEYAKEMRKHEALHTQYGAPMRPYVFCEYPTRMYKAGRDKGGKIAILEAMTARDETERQNLESRGFVHGGQGAAIKAWEAEEFSRAELAAERNYVEKRMSPKAQAEAQAADDEAGAQHLASVPELPVPAHRKAKNRKTTKH